MENLTQILESGRFDAIPDAVCCLSDSEIKAISHRTIWENDFSNIPDTVYVKLIKFARAISNETNRRNANLLEIPADPAQEGQA